MIILPFNTPAHIENMKQYDSSYCWKVMQPERYLGKYIEGNKFERGTITSKDQEIVRSGCQYYAGRRRTNRRRTNRRRRRINKSIRR